MFLGDSPISSVGTNYAITGITTGFRTKMQELQLDKSSEVFSSFLMNHDINGKSDCLTVNDLKRSTLDSLTNKFRGDEVSLLTNDRNLFKREMNVFKAYHDISTNDGGIASTFDLSKTFRAPRMCA